MSPPTRSHLRFYASNSSNPNNPSSVIFPIHPPGPSVASYAIRHNVASDLEDVGLVVGRIYTDADLPEPVAEGESWDGNTTDKNAMGEIWRLRKKEQEELDLLSPALLLLHVYPTGSTFLEVPSQAAVNPRTIVSLLRLSAGQIKPSLNRNEITIPSSTPPNHILVFLDCDSQISVQAGLHTHRLLYQTVEMSIAVPSTSEDNNYSEIYSTGREFIGDGEGSSVKSMKSGEYVEGGLGTPQRDKEVTRVLDTPHRHGLQDAMSLLQETQQSMFSNFDPTPDSGLASTARRLFPESDEAGGEGAETIAIDDDDLTNDEDDIVPTMPTTLPTSAGSISIRVINTLSPSPANRPNVLRPPSTPNPPITDPDPPLKTKAGAARSESEDTAEEKSEGKELPNSLPEAFKVAQEAKRLRYTPPRVKTYGHRRSKGGNTISPKTDDDNQDGEGARVEKLGEDSLTGTQEPELSPVPPSSLVKKAALQGNSKVKNDKKKIHKKEGKEVAESSQPEPESSTNQTESTRESMELDRRIAEVEEVEEEKEKGNVAASMGKRERLKRKSKYAVEISPVSKTQEEIPGSFDTEGTQQKEYEEEASQTMGDVTEESKGVKRKAPRKKEEGAEKMENKKPPKKKAKVTKGGENEDKGNNTQYTFVGSQDSEPENDEVEDTPIPAKPPIKTPAKRSRKSLVTATPAKTPHTTSTSALTSPLHGGARTEPYSGSSPKVVFSNSLLPNRKDHNNILRALGVKKAQNVTDAGVTHLVVGEGGLVRSSKLALALTLGLPIVTDSWLLDSYHNNPSSSASGSPTLLDSTPYIPSDPHNESAWRFSLPEAISRGKSGQLSTLLSTYSTIYLSPALLGHLKSTNQETGFMDILKATGAKKILKRAPKGTMEEELGDLQEGLIFGAGDGEKEVDLVKWECGGWRVYKTEMLTMSILRGTLEVGEEFKLALGDGVDKSQVSEKGGEATPVKAGRSGGGRRKSGKL